ncbi:hypothetical protein ACLK11_21355 [Escherichia coli]
MALLVEGLAILPWLVKSWFFQFGVNSSLFATLPWWMMKLLDSSGYRHRVNFDSKLSLAHVNVGDKVNTRRSADFFDPCCKAD